MKRKSHTEVQIIGVSKENEAGVSAQEVIRKHDIANGSFYLWKEKYDGMEVSEAKRFRELETENASFQIVG